MKCFKKSLLIILIVVMTILTGCNKSILDILNEGIETSAIDLMENEDLNSIKSDVKFINGINEDLNYNWVSSNPFVINSLGKVTRLNRDVTITITLRVSKNQVELCKEFYLRVLKDDENETIPPTDKPEISEDIYKDLQIALSECDVLLKINKGFNEVKSNLEFINGNRSDITYIWNTSNTSVCSKSGVINRPEKDENITITIKVMKNELSLSKSFNILVLRDDKFNVGDDYTYDCVNTKSKLRPSELNVVYENKNYNDYLDLVSYIYHFKHLPDNYLTKAKANSFGWSGSGSNVWENDRLKGCYIGGDTFKNRERILPNVGSNVYIELDVNCKRGQRGSNRIVYNRNTFDIYYTNNHYKSFTYMIGQ